MAASAGGLAVHHEGPPDRPAQPPHPGPELGPVGVRRVAADGLDLGAARVHPRPRSARSPRRSWIRRPSVCSAWKPTNRTQVPVIADAVAPGGAGSGPTPPCRDAAMMTAGPSQRVERLGLGHVAHVAHQREVEQRRRLRRPAARARSKTSGCIRNTVGRVHRERAVHVDRDLGNPAARGGAGAGCRRSPAPGPARTPG